MWYDIDARHQIIKLRPGEYPTERTVDGLSWDERRRVAQTDDIEGTGAWVSTVFLGLDHAFARGGEPVLFESMAFPSPIDFCETAVDRYTTWDEAVAGHAAMVERVRQRIVESRPSPPPAHSPLRTSARVITLDDDE